MKKILLFLCLLLIPLKVEAISASAYIVMDQDSGLILEGTNLEKKSLIASITKIMTCYVALTYGNLSDEIEVKEEILKSYGSGIYVEIGEKLTLEDLLYGLMLRSGNDAAYVIAKHISGSMTEFAKLMNNVAKSLNMKNTFFYNAHGLEEDNGNANTSTVKDMAILTRIAMKNKNYREIVKTKKKVVKTNYKTYIWYNKNRLLTEYKYATGGKTGFTKKAKRTLVTTASNGGRNIIIVTFNDGNDFNDHKALYQKYFNSHEKVNVLDKKTYEKDYDNYKLYIKNSYNVLVAKDKVKEIRIEENIDDIKIVTNNSKVGVISVYLKDKLIHQENIYINSKPQKIKTSFWVRIWRKIKSWLT